MVQAKQATAFQTNIPRLPLPTAPENEEMVLEMTVAAASMYMLKDTNRMIMVLIEERNTVCYIYDAAFPDLEELHEPSGGKDLPESLNYVTCDPSYNLGHQSEL